MSKNKKVATRSITFTNGSAILMTEGERDQLLKFVGPLGFTDRKIEPREISKKEKLENLEFSSLVGIMNAKNENDEDQYYEMMDDLYEELLEIVE